MKNEQGKTMDQSDKLSLHLNTVFMVLHSDANSIKCLDQVKFKIAVIIKEKNIILGTIQKNGL